LVAKGHVVSWPGGSHSVFLSFFLLIPMHRTKSEALLGHSLPVVFFSHKSLKHGRQDSRWEPDGHSTANGLSVYHHDQHPHRLRRIGFINVQRSFFKSLQTAPTDQRSSRSGRVYRLRGTLCGPVSSPLQTAHPSQPFAILHER
jgi:hypothetical protein